MGRNQRRSRRRGGKGQRTMLPSPAVACAMLALSIPMAKSCRY